MKSKSLQYLLGLVWVVTVVVTLAMFVRIWPFELLVSFTPQIFIALGLVGLLSTAGIFWSNRAEFYWPQIIMPILVLVTLCLSLGYASMLQPVAQPAVLPGNTMVRFITFNKLYTNTKIDEMAAYFKTERPDVIALQEIAPNEVRRLASAMGYRHSYVSDYQNTVRGTSAALISRHPIVEQRTIPLSQNSSLVRIVTEVPGKGRIAFYAVHLVGPFSEDMYRERNEAARQMAFLLEADKLPLVIGGDFNTTVFSPILQDFNTVTTDSLYSVTAKQWPPCSWYGYGAPLCLRIDHVYHSQSLSLAGVRIAPNLGSDHRAVITDLQ
ncbi:endonuclease/exonuclease/phosphatase family protein [Candidatus Saccharibacteria bacterium]|nr:endonuclease/exonuclease/phosphatase family protein [Candidatus Saccharibacteria bacterium]